MTNQKFAELFGIPRRDENAKAEQIHYDIAASAQKVLEDIMLKMVNHVHKKTGMKKSMPWWWCCTEWCSKL